MATAPAFAALVDRGSAAISTANTGRDGTGTLGTVLTAPTTRSVADGVTTSGSFTVTSATAAFTLADQGRPIAGAGIPAGTTIAAYISSTSVLLSAAATASASSVTIAVIGLGARIDEVRILATSTTTAGMVRLYTSDGTNHRLLAEQTIAAVTPSATVKAEAYTLPFTSLFLKPGETLRASTHNGEAFVVTAFGGDF